MTDADLLLRFNALVEKVQTHMGWDADKTLMWFQIGNPGIGGVTPVRFFALKPDKCERWIDSMIEENTRP